MGKVVLDPDTPGSLRRSVLQGLLDGLERTPGSAGIDRRHKDEILGCSDEEIERAIRDVMAYQPPADMDIQLDREFSTFRKGAQTGVPPVSTPRPSSRTHLEIDPGRVQRFPGPNGKRIMVVPVLKLRAVTAQVGYRRMVGSSTSSNLPDLVDISFRDHQGNLWFPAFESFGEGLFIMLDDNAGWHPVVAGKSAHRWYDTFRAGGSYNRLLFRGPSRRELHPMFVWWHTLSHLLIRSLAADSGYSVPSIRERIYLEVDSTGRTRGGILLYTLSRGADGSLGGLIALTPVFDRILNRALEALQVCSADPLCLDREFQPGQLLGASCHACCLISETSCEHRNFWLDRHVLLDNMP